jgi:hypothetical protein
MRQAAAAAFASCFARALTHTCLLRSVEVFKLQSLSTRDIERGCLTIQFAGSGG